MDATTSSRGGTALVTGGTGFIGAHLVRRLLDEGRRVRVLVRGVPPGDWETNGSIEIVRGDLADAAAVDTAATGVECVYHLGAATHGTAEAFQRGTVLGTTHVVDAVLRRRVPRLVYMSSLSVLHAAAIRATSTPDELWPLEPYPELRGWYTRSKLEAEYLVRRAVREQRLPAILLRPGHVFGPGASLMTPAVAQRIANRWVILGSGRLRVPLVYVDDVVDALRLAAECECVAGSVYHLVDASEITQRDLADRYCRARGEARPLRLPAPLATALATIVEEVFAAAKREAPLSRYRLRSVLAPVALKSDAARRDLGWRPKVGWREGLRRTLSRTTPS